MSEHCEKHGPYATFCRACDGDTIEEAMTDKPTLTQAERAREPVVIVHSSVCGRHFDEACPSCQSAKESNDRRLLETESALSPAPVEVAEVVERLKAALTPFVNGFQQRRSSYSKRYTDPEIGRQNFDKMPDNWPVDALIFGMGAYRRAETAVNELPTLLAALSSQRAEGIEALPQSARVVAYDRDECTVTLAFDNKNEVIAVRDALPHGNRVRLIDESAPYQGVAFDKGDANE